MVENTINLFNEHFGGIGGKYAHIKTSADEFSKRKQEELAAEIVADQERLDEERVGRRRSEEDKGQWSGLTERGKVKNEIER